MCFSPFQTWSAVQGLRKCTEERKKEDKKPLSNLLAQPKTGIIIGLCFPEHRDNVRWGHITSEIPDRV